MHPPSNDQPGIIVHICEEDEELTENDANKQPKLRIEQTRCPARAQVSS